MATYLTPEHSLLGKRYAASPSTSRPVLPFSKLNKIFYGYFDPENIFLDNKNK